MILKIYHSRQNEDLAEKLVGELKTERKVPFGFLKVAVANLNFEKCLNCMV